MIGQLRNKKNFWSPLLSLRLVAVAPTRYKRQNLANEFSDINFDDKFSNTNFDKFKKSKNE